MNRATPRRAAPLASLPLLALLAAPAAAGAACPEGMRALSGGHFRLADGSAVVEVAAYCLDQVEVTSAGYAACVRGGACAEAGLQCGRAATFGAQGKATHPVNCVTWFDAVAFCSAQGKRLPTEGEWEWAARGQARALTFPWGEAPPADRACWDGTGSSAGAGGRNETCPVATHPHSDSPDGLSDLGGNVREWTSGEDGRLRVVRGGSWGDSLPDFLAAGFRGMNAPDERFELTGFRCAAEPVAALGASGAAPASTGQRAPPSGEQGEGGPLRIEIGAIQVDARAGAGGR